jgi:hypothetical protein
MAFRDGTHLKFSDHAASAQIVALLEEGPRTARTVAQACGIHSGYALSLLLLAASEGVACPRRSSTGSLCFRLRAS